MAAQKPRDLVDVAVDKVEQEAKEPDSFETQLAFPDGTRARVVVPFEFDSDKFETLVSALMQLRVMAEQRKQERPDGIVLPDRPKIVLPS